MKRIIGVIRHLKPSKVIVNWENYPAFSWVERGAVTKVKNNNDDTCWAEVATHAMESHHCLNTGELLDLSSKYLVDKSDKKKGGTILEGFEIANKHGGLPLASDYPCTGEPPLIKLGINAYETFSFRGSKKHIMHALSKQPVTVDFKTFKEYENYRGGVIKARTGLHKGGNEHATLVVRHGWEGKYHFLTLMDNIGEDWGRVDC